MANKNSQGEKLNKIGIKWKMFCILLIFIVAVISVIWIFQVGMLNVFYQNTKFSELKISYEKLSSSAENKEDFFNAVYDCAEDYFSSIVVFHVEENVAKPVIEAGSKVNTIMPFFSKSDMQSFYENANKNGGQYMAAVSYGLSNKNNEESVKPIENRFDTFFSVFGNKLISALHASIIYTGTEEYFVVQTVELMPVNAVVKTLNNQFLWIGVILVLLALALAGIMSRLITKPIIKMNAAAQSLALGNYDADFSGGGYREIYELSEALNYASSELQKTDRLQKELISNVSHDLRTPLTMIKGYGEVMRDIPRENTPENVQVIIDETERLATLVSDMLDMSRLKSGTRSPDMQLFSLTEAIQNTMKRYEKLIMQDGYKIDFLSDRNIYVYADSIMILQVVYNLINNAVNYTGDDKYVCVTQSIDGEKVRISVTDTGNGISKDDLPLIWERYYKVDTHHKRAAIGTGLGLSIVKEILEMHRAKFGVNSTLGEGSTFWFELDIEE